MDKTGFLAEDLLKVELVSIKGQGVIHNADTVRPHHFSEFVMELMSHAFFYLLHVKLHSQADDETQRLYNKFAAFPFFFFLFLGVTFFEKCST